MHREKDRGLNVMRIAAFAVLISLLALPVAFAQKAEDRAAEDQYNFATELFGKKLYELAIQQYEKFAVEHPNHPNIVRARIRIGESYLRLDKNEQAVAAYEKVLAEKPDSNFRLEVLVGIGLANYNLKRYTRAIESLQEGLTLATQAKDANLGPIAANWLGESYFQSGRYAEAAIAYQLVEKQWPDSSLVAQAVYSLGFCQQKQGKEEEAAVTWLRLVNNEKLNGTDVAAEANYRAGEALLRMKRYAIAQKTFEALLSRYKNSTWAPQAQMGLGWCAFNQKDWGTARTAFEAVSRLYPGTEQGKQARIRAADCAYYLKDYASAAALYEAVVRGDNPQLAAEARYWLAICQIQTGQTKPAMALLAQVGRESKDPAIALRARIRLAQLQLDSDDYASAGETYRAAVAAGIPDPETLDQATYGLGICLYRQKRTGEAEAQFAAILQRPTKTSSTSLAALGLAQCRVDQQHYKEAVPVLAELLKKNDLPTETRAPALFLMGQAQAQLKQYDQAILAYRELVDKHEQSPHAASAAASLAILYREAKRDREAEEITGRLVSKYGKTPAAIQALLSLADGQRDKGNLAGAIDLYQKALAGAPTPTDRGLANAGLALCYAGSKPPDVQKANAALKALGEAGLEPGYEASVRYHAGFAYERAQLPDPALEQYRTALAKNPPADLAALLGLRSGSLLANQRRFDEAAALLKGVIQQSPAPKVLPEALYELAWVYLDTNKPADARPYFERLEKEFADHKLSVDATFRLAEDDYANKQLASAMPRYEKVANSPLASELQIQDKAWYKLGWCARELKQTQKLILGFSMVVTKFPNSELAPESRLRAAEAMAEKGDLKEAADLLRPLVAVKPANDAERWLVAQAQVVMGGIYLKQNEYAAAEKTAEPAATTAFGQTGAQAALIVAEAQFAQKQYKDALTNYLKVITIFRARGDIDAQCRFKIAECADKLGQREQAKQYWQDVVKDYPDTEWAQKSKERLGR
jgi:TolA-binding protein